MSGMYTVQDGSWHMGHSRTVLTEKGGSVCQSRVKEEEMPDRGTQPADNTAPVPEPAVECSRPFVLLQRQLEKERAESARLRKRVADLTDDRDAWKATALELEKHL